MHNALLSDLICIFMLKYNPIFLFILLDSHQIIWRVSWIRLNFSTLRNEDWMLLTLYSINLPHTLLSWKFFSRKKYAFDPYYKSLSICSLSLTSITILNTQRFNLFSVTECYEVAAHSHSSYKLEISYQEIKFMTLGIPFTFVL